MASILSVTTLAMVMFAIYSQAPGEMVSTEIVVTEITDVMNWTDKKTTKGPTTTPISTTKRPSPVTPCKIPDEAAKFRRYLAVHEGYEFKDSFYRQQDVYMVYFSKLFSPKSGIVSSSKMSQIQFKASRDRAWYMYSDSLYLIVKLCDKVLPLLVPFVLGVIGNILVLVTVITYMKTKSVTNILLASLAVTDLLTLLFAVPLKTYQYTRSVSIPLGKLCPAIFYVQFVLYHASIYTLVVIAVERFLTICFPLKSKLLSTPSTIKKILVLVWILAIAMSMPALWVYIEFADIRKNACYTTYFCGDYRTARQKMELIYNDNTIDDLLGPLMGTFIGFNYFIPLLFMIMAYGAVAVTLIRSIHASKKMKSAGDGKDKSSDTDADSRTRLKIVKMLIAVVVCFALLWGPYVVWQMLFWIGAPNAVYNVAMTDGQLYATILSLVYGLAYCNSCVNPIIYLCMSKSFRDGFLYAFGCKKKEEGATSKLTASSRLSSSAASSATA